MPDSRPMPSIGRRCHELRIPEEDVTWRIFYRIDEDAIVILGVLKKKTRVTPQTVIATSADSPSTIDERGAVTMDKKKKAHLEANGWRVGSAEKFLGLSPDEAAYVELRLRLSDAVRDLRKKKHLTQAALAERLRSSQSRIAKIEAADDSVSLDLLIRSLLALGVTEEDLAKVIAGRSRRVA